MQKKTYHTEGQPDPISEGVKKNIESVIIFIPGRARGGGGSAGSDHTLLCFFQCSKPTCLAL